ncbi:MAG: S1 RNA-binding domain-containing protein, partial [Clostridia bacterium]|nr:S1 RNA-binding domain-containing protein [Clostridia bacterium]
PASQIRIGYVSNLEDSKGKTLRLTLMPQKEKAAAEGEDVEAQEDKPQKKSRYLFASQRIILEREKKEKEDLFWDNIHVHDIVTGKVKRFTAFGAFVSVRGFDCLAHISELSWNKITDPAKVLKIGESYDFVVLKMDRETGKISLGYKQLQKKPYEVAAEKFPVGTIIKGKVERIFPYGAFVSIDDGVDGLVHVSQISHNWIKDANEALTVGQEVEAKIIGFDDNRITLSIKELLPAPEEAPAPQEGEAPAEPTDEEKAAKRAQRAKKFEKKEDGAEPKRERRGAKKEASNEPKEWVSGSSNATLGDLLGSLNLDLDDEKKD